MKVGIVLAKVGVCNTNEFIEKMSYLTSESCIHSRLEVEGFKTLSDLQAFPRRVVLEGPVKK